MNKIKCIGLGVILLGASISSVSQALELRGEVNIRPNGRIAEARTILHLSLFEHLTQEVDTTRVFAALQRGFLVVATNSKTCTGYPEPQSGCVTRAKEIPANYCLYCGFGDGQTFDISGNEIDIDSWDGACKSWAGSGGNGNK